MISQNSPLYPLLQYEENLEQQISNLHVQVDDLNQQNQDKDSKITDLNGQVSNLSAQTQSLQQNIDVLNSQINDLKNTPPVVKTVTVDLTPNQIKAQRILGVALTHNDMRTPYKFGAEWQNDKEFDCSSFTQYCYRVGAGINIPRNKQYTYAGSEVTFDQLQPADLIFYDFPEGGGRDGVTDHVGMYLGDGKMIHTNTPATGINIVNVATWNRASLVKIWRILN